LKTAPLIKTMSSSGRGWIRTLPFYLLQQGDLRSVAATLSCHQAIAGDSAFSLGMLARFEPLLREAPWLYPWLFWESGMIGQVLYLEAEDKGLRGTGSAVSSMICCTRYLV
jgi:hypothetical protein